MTGPGLALTVTGVPTKSGRIHKSYTSDPYVEDLAFSPSWSPSPLLAQWLASAIDGKRFALSPGIHIQTAQSQAFMQLANAVPNKIIFPGGDVQNPEQRDIEVSLAIDSADIQPESVGLGKPKQKVWLCSNFRLKIDGIDTTGVIATSSVQWEPHKSPGLDVPEQEVFSDLTVVVDASLADGFTKWFQSILPGEDGQHNRNGTLEYLDQDGSVLVTLTLSNLGIFKGTPDPIENKADNIRRVKFEMYMESASVTYGRERLKG